MSVATFRKDFRKHVAGKVVEIEEGDGELRLVFLASDLTRKGQIGQLLGFANSHHGNSLYDDVALLGLGQRELAFNSYSWDSMEEYESFVDYWRDRKGNEDVRRMYEGKRSGVEWLISNRHLVAQAADEWRLLFELFSNHQMNLHINDVDPLYCFIRYADLSSRNFTAVAGAVTQG